MPNDPINVVLSKAIDFFAIGSYSREFWRAEEADHPSGLSARWIVFIWQVV